MDEISKKDLLVETGISYGQLYRWKREGLIPEEWFIKRAVFTGQETFFPRERMLGRVRAILALKDDLSLDQIRERLEESSPRCDVKAALLAATGGDKDFVDALKQPAHYRELPLATLAPALGICEWLTRGKPRNKIPHARRLQLIDEALELSAFCAGDRSIDGRAPGDRAPSDRTPDDRAPGGHPPATATLFEVGNEYYFCLSGSAEAPRFDEGVRVLVHLGCADVVERYRSQAAELSLEGAGQ
jgi:DNA-binding transcriptional MerR regulator